MLKQQSESKDSRIRFLEEQLRSLQSPVDKTYNFSIRGVH